MDDGEHTVIDLKEKCYDAKSVIVIIQAKHFNVVQLTC